MVVAPGSIGIESSGPADNVITGIIANTAIPEMNSTFAQNLRRFDKVRLTGWNLTLLYEKNTITPKIC